MTESIDISKLSEFLKMDNEIDDEQRMQVERLLHQLLTKPSSHQDMIEVISATALVAAIAGASPGAAIIKILEDYQQGVVRIF